MLDMMGDIYEESYIILYMRATKLNGFVTIQIYDTGADLSLCDT